LKKIKASKIKAQWPGIRRRLVHDEKKKNHPVRETVFCTRRRFFHPAQIVRKMRSDRGGFAT